MNRRELIKKGLGLSVAATGILGIISTKSRANQAALAALEALIQQVTALNLQAGIDNSLDAKIEAAKNALDDINENNNVAAINSMEAFINAVEAQRGNKIEDADANSLIESANGVIAALSACSCGCDCGVVGCNCEPPCVPPCDGTGGGGY